MLTFDDLLAPTGGHTLFAVGAGRLQFVFVDTDWTDVLVEVQFAFQMQESDVTFQIGWLVRWMHCNFDDTLRLEWFGLFSASQFPFSGLDQNIACAQTSFEEYKISVSSRPISVRSLALSIAVASLTLQHSEQLSRRDCPQ